MTKYGNKGRDSGISMYEIRDDGIAVQFSTGATYLYTNASAGITNIGEMKKMAIRGEGLNSFIMRHVRTLYASKLS